MKKYRLISTVAILISIIFLPYWIYLPLLTVAIFYFRFYWEGLILAFFIDVFYGTFGFSFTSPYHSASFWTLIILLLLLPLRRIIRNYA